MTEEGTDFRLSKIDYRSRLAMKRQKTRMLTKEEALLKRRWFLVDADGQVLGRLATAVAKILMGKHKPQYTPHNDSGDFVVVVNAKKIRITGKKLDQKEYLRYTGYPGGLRRRTLKEMLERSPDKVIRLAVKRMLPKNRLGRRMLSKLKIYDGDEHPHTAQKPEPTDPFRLAYGGVGR